MTVRRNAIRVQFGCAGLADVRAALASSGDDDSSASTTTRARRAWPALPSNAAPAAKWSEIYPMIFPMSTNARCHACHGTPANDVANGNLSMGMDPRQRLRRPRRQDSR